MKSRKLLYTFLAFLLLTSAKALEISDLTCEHLKNPIGIAVEKPRFSWILRGEERNTLQVAYSIRVASAQDFARKSIVWESGKVNSDESVLVGYKGNVLRSRTRYYWQVKIWDNKGVESDWSTQTAFFETGFLSPTDWQAVWIELGADTGRHTPAVMMRKGFELRKKQIVQARAYVTAHGFYELYLNGKKVGDDVLTPGWTSYAKRLQYQVYDVTTQLQQGKNAVGAMLGEGWWRGTLAWENQWAVYGNRLGLLCQIHVLYADGMEDVIRTDNGWKATKEGPIRMNGIYEGETFDARKILRGWSDANFDDDKWTYVQMGNYDMSNLTASMSVPMRRIQEIKPKRVFRTPKGTLVADFGQNLVGWVRLKAKGDAGKTIKIRHAEVLDKHGEFYTANLRNAAATMTCILRGYSDPNKPGDDEVFEPRFTFFGFRYIAIDGFDGTPNDDNLTAVVIHSDMEKTGTFECSNPLVNQLQKNIEWGQKGNFVDVPTDCPQRDERLGWTGDAQVFCRTAGFNYNVASFFTKWMRDIAADQRVGGEIPVVIPDVLNKQGSATAYTSAGWGDVATIAPWTIYQVYGDKGALEVQYPSMKAWVEYIRKRAGDSCIWKGGSIFGDWLFYRPKPESASEPDGATNQDYISTVFYAYSCKLLAESAAILGKAEDARAYNALFKKIQTAFLNEYVTPSGRTASDSQTSYVLALMCGLLPDELKPKAARYLVEDIRTRKNHLSTGFLGTPYLCHVLTENGYTDVSYDLLMQETYPSWLYPVKMGATTIWERWDGQKPDSTFQSEGMNSFNHYAYGAIGDWMYRVAAGIELGKAGYKHILIQPQPTTRWNYAKASVKSPYGTIATHWVRQNGKMQFSFTIPANTTATVTLPTSKKESLLEEGQLYAENKSRNLRVENGRIKFEVGSGTYSFEFLE